MKLEQKPDKPQSNIPKPSATRSPSGQPQPQRVKQVSATGAALKAAKQKTVAIAVIQKRLEESASLYYESNFDPSFLPSEGEEREAVKDLAKTYQQADQFTYGEFYAAPGVIDVTALPATSDGLSFDPSAYFAPANKPLQLAGGQ